MSIRDVDVVDYAYLEDDTGMPVLVVSDPLTWKPPEDEDHLELLREKLNSQIAFVETGQLGALYPPYRGGLVRVEVVARHALNLDAREFTASPARSCANRTWICSSGFVTPENAGLTAPAWRPELSRLRRPIFRWRRLPAGRSASHAWRYWPRDRLPVRSSDRRRAAT